MVLKKATENYGHSSLDVAPFICSTGAPPTTFSHYLALSRELQGLIHHTTRSYAALPESLLTCTNKQKEESHSASVDKYELRVRNANLIAAACPCLRFLLCKLILVALEYQ